MNNGAYHVTHGADSPFKIQRTPLTNLLRIVLLGVTLMAITSMQAGDLSKEAKAQEGGFFERGKSYQCSNWVASVARKSGKTPPKNHGMARSWLKWGRGVPFRWKRRGDVIVTWRGSPRSTAGHVLIYVGGGQAIHRSTHSSPIRRVDVSDYKDRIIGVRRG